MSGARTLLRRSAGALALALALPVPSTLLHAGTIVRQGGRRVVVATGAEAERRLVLPDVLIVTGTDSVSVDGSPLARGVDYRIDYETSVLVVGRDVPDSSAVRVAYRYLPLGLSPLYRLSVVERASAPGDSAGPPTLVAAPAGAAARAGPVAGLAVGGAKTFGITMGSDRDVTLEQSLRLSVSGAIARDVTVNAYLSDQNTPLLPEGDTEELRALDKVLVEIEGPGVSATMGDYELRMGGGTLADVRRELSGAMARATFGSAEFLAAGASAAGEFASVTARGVDGKQGPYLLTDRFGGVGVSVVAGSERVWLDGERLARGRDRDYVIDYSAGEITFTERRPVLSESEFTIDYEYTLSDYARDTYAGRASASFAGGRAALGASFFKEADDRGSSPVVLTDQAIAIMSAAGDDVELAFDDGVDSVGVGQGDYVRLSPGVFEYAGADSGDHDLSFERAESGDYDYDYVAGFYRYVGPGEGRYRLGRSLPLPTDQTLVALDGRLGSPGGASVAVEAAVSDFDKNTFSDVDDDDNLGNAEVLSAGLPDATFGALGEGALGLSLLARRVGGDFRGMARYRDVRYQETWELQGLSLPEEELLIEASTALRLAGGGRFSAAHGRLERGDALGSRRWQLSAEARPTAGSRIWADARFVRLSLSSGAAAESGDRRRDLYRGGAEHTIGWLRPGVFYAHDGRTAGDAGERYDELGASLERAGAGRLSFGARYAVRHTDRSDGGPWAPASRTVTEEYHASLTGPGRLTLDGSVMRRSTTFEEGLAEPGTRYDLIGVRVAESLFADALRGEARYTVTSTEIEEKERYVTEADGEEIVRIVSTGRYLPVTELSASTRWVLEPRWRLAGRAGPPDPSPWRRFLSALTLETDLRLREATTTTDKRRLYLLDPSVLRGDDSVRGDVVGRHTIRYLAPNGTVSVRVAVMTRAGLDRSYTNSSEETEEREATADVKVSRGGATTVRLEGTVGQRTKDAEVGDTYGIDGRGAVLEVTADATRDIEAKLGIAGAYESEALTGVDATRAEIAPSLTYRFRGVGTATVGMRRVDVQTAADELPPYLAEGRARGVTTEWRATAEYRFNRNLTGSLSYIAEDGPRGDPRQTLDVRMNAFF